MIAKLSECVCVDLPVGGCTVPVSAGQPPSRNSRSILEQLAEKDLINAEEVNLFCSVC